jgi:hypothetical protein
MKDHFASPGPVRRDYGLNLPVTAALEAEAVSQEFVDGDYQPARGKPFTGDQFFRDRQTQAQAGELHLFPLQVGNAERLTHTLLKAEAACTLLRRFVEHGLSDPQAFAEIGNILSAAGQTVGKHSSGVATNQHNNEQRWALSESALKERVTVDWPALYDWTVSKVEPQIGDAFGGLLSKHRAADGDSKRRKTKAELREETRQLEQRVKKMQKPVESVAEPV